MDRTKNNMLKTTYLLAVIIVTSSSLYAGPAFYGFNREAVGGPSLYGVRDINNNGMVAIDGSASAIWSPDIGFIHKNIPRGILRVGKSGNSALLLSGGNSGLWTPSGQTNLPRRMWAMNYDGTVFAGQNLNSNLASIWDTQNGERSLGTLPTDDFGDSTVFDMTPDGQTLVGSAWNGSQTNAIKFNVNGEISDLGGLDGYTRNTGYGVSDNGRYIAGISRLGLNSAAFRWDKEKGELQNLGGRFSNDGINRRATDVSDDGTVVGGMILEDNIRIAMLFTDIDGWRSVEDMLIEDFGITIDPNWHLEDTSSISNDGTIIGGSGYYINDQGTREISAWVVTIPAPSSLFVLAAGLGPLSRRRR